MAFFSVNPTSTSEVSIAAAVAGVRHRITYLAITNDHATDRVTLTILDGASGTVRMTFSLLPGHVKIITPKPDYCAFPATWWTAGNAIVAKLSAAGSYRVWGESIVEPAHA